MKKPLFVLGTRPEAIKLIPIIENMRSNGIPCAILNTRQHTDILDLVLQRNNIAPDFQLNIRDKYKDLGIVKADMLCEICNTVSHENISAVIVQGDTLSALVGAEYGFLNSIPVCHVEAGMRTYNTNNPYPEEAFRKMISAMSAVHFCPSASERKNLLDEHVTESDIFVTGNTFIDYRLRNAKPCGKPENKILITLHRRENIPYLKNILTQIARMALDTPQYCWTFPVHPNPALVKPITEILGGVLNITLCAPLGEDEFYDELLRSELIITDSGGVHEECLINCKKVLIVRACCERFTNFDFVEMVNPDGNELADKFYKLLHKRTSAVKSVDCYGNGDAANKIVQILNKRGLI